ncbi:MAG: OmpA family protein [Polyangiaceae bacterium]
MRIPVRLLLAATLVVATPAGLVACGGGKSDAKSADGKGKKHHVEGKAAKVDAKAIEADPALEEKAKEKKKVKDYQSITVKEDEVDLNPGVSINFATGKDTISDESYGVLYEIWSVLDDNPDMRIRVEGNTDDVGPRDGNLDLSARRAARVYDFFVTAGVDPSRLDFVGCGPDNPLVFDTTSDARAANRRVDFIIMKDASVICGGVYDPPPAGDE